MDWPALRQDVFWQALAGPQAHLAVGDARVRRYAPGFSPLAAFADRRAPDFEALARLSTPEERIYIEGFADDRLPAGWRREAAATMYRMVWEGGGAVGIPDDTAPEAVPLQARHAERAVALATLTRPGPFGLRTPELGEYFGVFEGERLLAMAGERVHLPGFREVSGVCTHPDAQGRGLARRLMLKLIRRELLRGETPILHVMTANTVAWQLYERMGFRRLVEMPVWIIVRD